MRLIFAGTPEFARIQLQALIEAGYTVELVLTQPDKPVGRGQKMTPPPVKQYALEAGIRVLQPTTLKNPEIVNELAALKPDLMIVSAYGMLLPKTVLSLPKWGCWNVHASLLPRWRGAAPIQYAILKGDAQTGITLMQMDEGLDTGDMLLKRAIAIDSNDTTGSLHDKLATLGAKVLLEGLEKRESLEPTKQESQVSCLAPKITKDQAHINWELSAQQIKQGILAFNPWPGAWTKLNGETIKIWQAQVLSNQQNSQPPGTLLEATKKGLDVSTGQGILRMTHIQFPGKKVLPVEALLNSKGELFKPGTLLQ